MLRRIKIQNLRNIEIAELDISSSRVVLSGGNGSGKTTFLEAVYLVARGRSFRGRKAGSLTSDGKDGSSILVRSRDVDGLERERSLKIFGKDSFRWVGGVEFADSSAPMLEVRLVGEGAHALVQGDPSVRRRFLDWNLFHVEPSFLEAWRKFSRLQKQRNAWLASGAFGRAVWDDAYVAAAGAVTEARRTYIDQLNIELRKLFEDGHQLRSFELALSPGWPATSSLEDALAGALEQDRIRGYTFYGPGRADIHIRNEKRLARLSRGQAKAAVLVLQIAARNVLFSKIGTRPIWLVDDLGADLDIAATSGILEQLLKLEDQYFFTCIRGELGSEHNYHDYERFHVEHGTICRVS